MQKIVARSRDENLSWTPGKAIGAYGLGTPGHCNQCQRLAFSVRTVDRGAINRTAKAIPARKLWRWVLSASAVGLMVQLVYASFGSNTPSAIGAVIGAMTAFASLRYIETRSLYIALAIISGYALSVVFWVTLSNCGWTPAVSLADSTICPIVGFAIGRLDRSRRGPIICWSRFDRKN